jgi:hypothetical protein
MARSQCNAKIVVHFGLVCIGAWKAECARRMASCLVGSAALLRVPFGFRRRMPPGIGARRQPPVQASRRVAGALGPVLPGALALLSARNPAGLACPNAWQAREQVLSNSRDLSLSRAAVKPTPVNQVRQRSHVASFGAQGSTRGSRTCNRRNSEPV